LRPQICGVSTAVKCHERFGGSRNLDSGGGAVGIALCGGAPEEAAIAALELETPAFEMNRKTPPHSFGFTRLELVALLVVGGVLMALIFPLTNGRIERPERKAQTNIRAIANAVQGYYQDYGEYPAINPTAKLELDSACGDPAALMELPNARLFNILRDVDRPPNTGHVLNPRGQKYIETLVVHDPSSPRGGFLEVATNGREAGSFYDPWGRQYNIVMDANRDGTIQVGKYYSDFANEKAPQVRVGVFSLGKDRKLGSGGDQILVKNGTLSDDHVSWLSSQTSDRRDSDSR